MPLPTFLTVDCVHGIVSCNYHHYAILPDRVVSHLAETHQSTTTPAQRAAIHHELQQISSQVGLKQSYNDFIIPTTIGPPFPGLTIYQDCHRCSQCGYILAGESARHNMQSHIRQHHAQLHATKPRYEGITSKVYSQRYFTSVPASFHHLRLTSYFEVDPGAEDPRPYTPPHASGALPVEHAEPAGVDEPAPSAGAPLQPSAAAPGALLAQIHAATQWAETSRAERNKRIPCVPSIQSNPWLAHTKFPTVFAEMADWDEALSYIRVPTAAQEAQLHLLYSSVKSMVQAWQNVTATSSRYSRIRVMQESIDDVPTFPLEPYQNNDLRHAAPLQRVFVFFYRVLAQRKQRPPTLSMTLHQQDAWAGVVAQLRAAAPEDAALCVPHKRTLLTPLEAACHAFWLSLMQQTSCGGDFELALITPIAFLSLAPAGDGYRQVYNFATDISALKKLARMSTLHEHYTHAGILEAESQSLSEAALSHSVAGLSLSEVTELVREQDLEMSAVYRAVEATNQDIADRFCAWVHAYLTVKYDTPMQWMINTARFISKFRYGETLDAFVHWQGDNVTVRHVQTTLAKFSGMAWGEYNEAMSILCQLCFVTTHDALPRIPWTELQEDVCNETPGFSAFSLPPAGSPSSPLAAFSSFILARVAEQGPAYRQSPVKLTDLADSRQVASYCGLVHDLLQRLLCLVHLTSGQPARGTELLSLHHENSANNGLRNIFLYNGLLAVVPRYHKGYNRNKTLMTVYRFLPREVGSLVVWYLTLVRPFYAAAQHLVAPELADKHTPMATSPLLWPAADGRQHTDSAVLSTTLQRASQLWLGQVVNVSTMRHLIIAFGRKVNPKEARIKELSREDVEDILDDVEAEHRERQAGHSVETARLAYAYDVQSVFTHKFVHAAEHFKTSTVWHHALGFTLCPGEDASTASLFAASLDEEQHAKRLQANLNALLRQALGQSARFRGRQKECLEAVMRSDAVVAYIAGTGVGKSLAFLLPACFPAYGSAVVIVPLAALRTDLMDKCRKHRITCSAWQHNRCDEAAQLIFATPESLDNSLFVAMVRRLVSRGRLERIVVDEYHYVLLPDTDYRPQLLNLGNVTRYGVPLTLLSATVPFQQQAEALNLLGLPGDSITIRESTVRPNIRYEVHTLSGRERFDEAAMADYIREHGKPYAKIIVFVDHASTAEKLAKLLDAYRYHARMPEADKLHAQTAFGEAACAIMVATAAFFSGVSIADIRAVFQLGKPCHVIPWNQAAGRGGRDGRPSLARIVLSGGLRNHWYDEAQPVYRKGVDDFIQDNVKSPVCRRIVLDRYFDGDETRQMCMDGEEACDVCQRTYYTQAGQHVAYTRPTSGSAPHLTPEKPRRRALPATPARSVEADPFTATTPSPGYLLSSRKPAYGPWDSPTVGGASSSASAQHYDLTLSPKKHRWSSIEPSPQPVSASPLKRVRSHATSPSASQRSAPAAEALEYLQAQQTRELEYNRYTYELSVSERTRLFHEELPATQRYWIDHCVACFVDGAEFEHAREACGNYVSQLSRTYKNAMSSKWGQGQCWSCAMPLNCCPMWRKPGTDRPNQRPSPQAQCLDKNAIRDAWACLWEHCPAARQEWIRFIQATEGPGWDPSMDGTDFASHFRKVKNFRDDYKAGYLVLGLSWVTHKLFLSADSDPRSLRNASRSQ